MNESEQPDYLVQTSLRLNVITGEEAVTRHLDELDVGNERTKKSL